MEVSLLVAVIFATVLTQTAASKLLPGYHGSHHIKFCMLCSYSCDTKQ